MIEPTSTIAALILINAPAMPTSIQRWRTVEKQEQQSALPFPDKTTIFSRPRTVEAIRLGTEIEIKKVPKVKTAIERVVDRVGSFDAPGTRDALEFLGKLPSGYPLPLSVCSEDGVVGLFWKTEAFYADIEFPGGGVMSVFTRARGQRVVDQGLDDVPVEAPFDTWGPQFLQALLPASLNAA